MSILRNKTKPKQDVYSERQEFGSIELLFTIIGFSSLLGQILIIRELLGIFHGTEIVIGVFFCCWLAAIGIFAALGVRVVDRFRSLSQALFAHGTIILGISVALEIVVIRISPALFQVSPAELTPLRGVMVAGCIGAIFTGSMTGLLFPLGVASRAKADDKLISRLYGLEAIGGLLGAACFTLILVHYFEPIHMAALISLVTALGVLGHSISNGMRGAAGAAILAIFLSVSLFSGLGNHLSEKTIKHRWNSLHPGLELLVSATSPHQRIELARLGKQYSLFGDGKIISTFPDPYSSERLAALVMAQKPDAQKALLIGGATGGLVSAITQYPVSRIDIIEPDPKALNITGCYMSGNDKSAIKDPRTHYLTIDGRLFINNLESNVYDIILVNLPDPVSSFWNRYYTVEFFRAAKKGLKKNGVIVTGVTSSENFWGASVASYAGSIYNTIKTVFPYVTATPGDETLFIAALENNVFTLDPNELTRRFLSISPKTAEFDPTAFRTIVSPNRADFVAKELENAPVLINRDLDPISLPLAMILWGKFTGENSLFALNKIREHGSVVFLIPIGIFLVFQFAGILFGKADSHECQGQVSLFCMFISAFTAMGTQLILIYSYQSLFGYLFEQIGLLSALFMAGLAAGAWITGSRLKVVKSTRLTTSLAMLVMAGLTIILPYLLSFCSEISSNAARSLVFIYIPLIGLITGSIFSLTAAWRYELSKGAYSASGWVDSADHLGAALGALLVAAIIAPLLGAHRACMIMAVWLAGQSFVVLMAGSLKRSVRRIIPATTMGKPSFPYTRTTCILLFIVCLAFCWRLLIGSPQWEARIKFSQDFLSEVSGASDFRFKDAPFPYYTGIDKEDNNQRFCMATYPLAPTIQGYGGPLNMLLTLDSKGVIHGLELVQSHETPSYVEPVRAWLKGFKGLSLKAPLESRIDTVSGATITSSAIIETIEEAKPKIIRELFRDSLSESNSQRSNITAGLWDWRVLTVIVALIIFYLAFISGSKRLRIISLLTGFLTIGVALNCAFSSMDIFQVALWQWPGGGVHWKLALIAGILISGIIWGQAYCGYMCPFGALQEILSYSSIRRKPSQKVMRPARYLKFLILGALLSLALISGNTIWNSFSPLIYFFGNIPGPWEIFLCAVILFFSIFYFRFWCRYLCPAGAFLALFNKVALLRAFAPKIKPGKCDLGVSHNNDVDCIRCHRCVHGVKTIAHSNN